MEKKSLFKYDILSENQSVQFVSSKKYINRVVNNFKIYIPEIELVRIPTIFQQLTSLDSIEIAKLLQRKIYSGVFIIQNHDILLLGTPFLDTSLYWQQRNKQLILSDSGRAIADCLKLSISKKVITTNLIPNLPYYPFQELPLWEGLEKVCPFHGVQIKKNELSQIRLWEVPKVDKNIKNKHRQIRDRFIEIIAEKTNIATEISSDLSGGVDSATIAYTLNSLGVNYSMFHSPSDSKWNSDTKWAEMIATNLNKPLNILTAMTESELRFELDKNIEHVRKIEFPLLWADTEGYVESLARLSANAGTHIHFTGLGGDELFTPMASFAWTLVREERARSIELGLRYCLLSRIPLVKGGNQLINSATFKESLLKELHTMVESKEQKSQNDLNWCGSFKVPYWIKSQYKDAVYKFLVEVIEKWNAPLATDRSRHQMLESLLFQRRVISQLNEIYYERGIVFVAPFLDIEIIEIALSMPIKLRQSANINKPMMYESFKGIMPKEIFTRKTKGDYSNVLYSGYKKAVRKYQSSISNFELVKLGIVDADALKSDLSMPTALHERIDFFERLSAVERILRSVEFIGE